MKPLGSSTTGWHIETDGTNLPEELEAHLDNALTYITEAGGGPVELWVQAVDDSSDRIVVELGFTAYRDLWQMRCGLPTEPSTLSTRSYQDPDADALIALNNRAFSWHPEQSGLDRQRLRATMSEPWFDPDGLRLYEVDGSLVGFCWTKIHQDGEARLGEIFVIGVDPSAHGKGLGRSMTQAGLDWLANAGISTAMLYVESDNHAATRTYEKIGFTHHQTNRAYRRSIEPSPR